ncbi:MAG: phosphate acyltransferase, partial [Candidatus Promineifilaceae bacterium]
MHIVNQLEEKAKAIGARIVLPEGDDPRVQAAARMLVGVVRPILIAKPDQILAPLPDDVTVIDPSDGMNSAEFIQPYYELRKHKGMTLEKAEQLVRDPLVLGAMMIKMGSAEGCVAGATHATRDVLRAALQIIGMADGYKIVSSTFLMILPDGRPLTYGDCGMVPNPNTEQLASIAIASASTHQQLTGQAAKVAMLSFSTKGSAAHPDVTKVIEATALAQSLAPDLAIDGELQFDAALLPSIGTRKA